MEQTKNNYPIAWQKSVVRNFCEVPLDKPSPYTSIELQRAENNGRAGFIVLLNHGNRELDILFEEQLALNEQWALTEPATAHLTVRNLKAATFSTVRCFVSATEVDAQATFKDLRQRKIEFRVKHRFAQINRPMFTPAPPQKDPLCLRFLAMDTFHLLPAYADVSVVMDGTVLPTSAFVLPKGVSPFSSTRIGGSFLLASLVLFSDINDQGARSSNVSATRIVDQDLWMELMGLPAYSDLNALQTGDSLMGDFAVNSPLGHLARGRYQCNLGESGLNFSLDNVAQDWKPGWRSPARGMMRHVRNYNRRTERWAFNAIVSSDATGRLSHDGAWTNE